MFTRRELIVSGVAAGTLGTPAPAGAAEQDSVYLPEIRDELRIIRRAVTLDGADAVARIRQARRAHLKNTSRYPELVDVGLDVFEATIDWLVATGQPMEVSRLGDGRYFVMLLGTTVVLRTDFPDNYVGQGYDR